MKKYLLFMIIAFLLAGLLGFSKGTPLSRQIPPLNKTQDPTEAERVMETIKRAYEIEAEAARTFDLEEFPAVFINDPRYPVDSYTLEFIKDVTHNPSLNTAGYLDYKSAYYSWWRDGALRREALEERAKAENRNLTMEESQSLVDSDGRVAPQRRKDPISDIYLEFQSITFNEDIATVVLNDGPMTIEMTLVLVDGKWFIAGYTGLLFHP